MEAKCKQALRKICFGRLRPRFPHHNCRYCYWFHITNEKMFNHGKNLWLQLQPHNWLQIPERLLGRLSLQKAIFWGKELRASDFVNAKFRTLRGTGEITVLFLNGIKFPQKMAFCKSSFLKIWYSFFRRFKKFLCLCKEDRKRLYLIVFRALVQAETSEKDLSNYLR